MGEYGSGFSGGDLNGNGHFDGGDYEMWKDIEHGSNHGGIGGTGALEQILAWTLIIGGIILGAIFPPFGILIWLGAKVGS